MILRIAALCLLASLPVLSQAQLHGHRHHGNHGGVDVYITFGAPVWQPRIWAPPTVVYIQPPPPQAFYRDVRYLAPPSIYYRQVPVYQLAPPFCRTVVYYWIDNMGQGWQTCYH